MVKLMGRSLIGHKGNQFDGIDLNPEIQDPLDCMGSKKMFFMYINKISGS